MKPTEFSECKDTGAAKKIHALLRRHQRRPCLSKNTLRLLEQDLNKIYGKKEGEK